MPRTPREALHTSFFHAITQGINKIYIFNYPEDIKFYIKIMYELLKEHNVKIISYCIMNNHTHMLIETPNVNELSKYMQRLNSKYGRYYNTKYNRVGYVFRDRYKSQGIYTEKQLYNCMKYIYDNPVKAGICKNPEDYPYSNYKKVPIETIDGECRFIDVEDEENTDYKREIENFMSEKNIDFEELKKDMYLLEKLVKLLRDKYKISFIKIGKEFNLCKEKVRRLYNK